MPNVVRFALPSARDLYVPGVGIFVDGYLDVPTDWLSSVERARYRTPPYGAIEIGIVDAATPKAPLPAAPVPPPADPYPQYLDTSEVWDSQTGRLREDRIPERLSQASLGAAFETPRANTVVVWGDSYAARTDATSGIDTYRSAQAPWSWAAVLTRHRMRLVKNAGVHGQGTADILARFDTDVAAHNPGWVVIMAGTNDVAGGVSAAAVRDNLTAMLDAVASIGAYAVVATIPPRNTLTAAQRLVQVQVNQWLRDQAATRKRMALVDFWTPLLDPATFGVNASVAPDGIHPNGVGAARLGRALAAVFNQLAPERPLLGHSTENPLLLTANPYLTGTGGTLGTGVTGSVAAGWTVQSETGSAITATASKVARTDGIPGDWQQISLTAGTGVVLLQNEDGVNTDWIPGTTQVYAECEFQTDADLAAVTKFHLGVYTLNAAFQGQGQVEDLQWISGDTWAPEARLASGVFRTPVLTIPATADKRVVPNFTFRGTGTFRVGRMALYKVS